MEAIKLLPWCVSVAVPFCYTSGAVTLAAQQDKSIPTESKPHPTTSKHEPEPHGSLVPGPSRGLTPPPGTSPLLVSSLPDIPLSDTLLVEHPLSHFLAIPSQGKWTTLPVVHLTILTLRGPMSYPPKLRLGVSTAPHRVMTMHLT